MSDNEEIVEGITKSLIKMKGTEKYE